MPIMPPTCSWEAHVNYELLFSGGGAANTAAAILGALYNPAPASTAVTTGNPITDLKLAQANQAGAVAKEAKLPEVARDIALFQKGIGRATSIQGALSDPNVMKVLLTANNLSRYITTPALARKALLSDPSDPKSLVNQLGDSALLSAARTYNFAKNGLTGLAKPQVRGALGDAYAEVLWRQSLDAATPGLANALTFMGQAKQIAKVDDILGDQTNRAVVLTALGIPQQIAFQTLPTQEAAVAARVRIADFQKPAFVQGLTDQYLLHAAKQAQAASGTATLSLFTRGTGLLV